MAFLHDVINNTRCYLYAHHSFGRLAYSVNTVLSDPQISKIHGIIEWENGKWFIRDLSTNGTWLNQEKLIKNKKYPINIGDQIRFTAQGEGIFLVKDLSAPGDLLVPVNCNGSAEVEAIELHQYHLLPSDQSPEIVISYEQSRGQWCIETVNDTNQSLRTLNENDFVEFANQQWQLRLSHLESPTEQLPGALHSPDKLDFIFELSLDEESTQLKLVTPDETIDFYIRSHHYLTLSLARYRALDAMRGLDEKNQGWVYTEQLAKDLGIDVGHLNIQIHRARKQFVDTLSKNLGSEYLIQRQAGKIRFGSASFEIYKGQKIETVVRDSRCMEDNFVRT